MGKVGLQGKSGASSELVHVAVFFKGEKPPGIKFFFTLTRIPSTIIK